MSKTKYYHLSLQHSQGARYLYFLVNDEAENGVSVNVNKACVLFDKEEKEGFLAVPTYLIEDLEREITVFEQGDEVVFNTPENLEQLGLQEEEGVLVPMQQYYVLPTDYNKEEDSTFYFLHKTQEEDECITKNLRQAKLTTVYAEDFKYLFLKKERMEALSVDLEAQSGIGVYNTAENRAALGLEYDEDLTLVRMEEKEATETEAAPKESSVSYLGIGLKALSLLMDLRKAYRQAQAPSTPNPPYQTINDLAQQIHQVNRDKGFWDKERNVGEMLMLVTSELGEAMEAHRKGKFADWEAYSNEISTIKTAPLSFKKHLKDSFEDELADATIRLLDMAAGLKIDLDKHIQAKLDYNRTRARFHGKQY